MGFCDRCNKYRDLKRYAIWLAKAKKTMMTMVCAECARNLDKVTITTR